MSVSGTNGLRHLLRPASRGGLSVPVPKRPFTSASSPPPSTSTSPSPSPSPDAIEAPNQVLGGPSLNTKRVGHASSAVFLGVEVAFKVNHVDPQRKGGKDVKLSWVADGSHALVDVESALWRGRLGRRARADGDERSGLRFEVQGPGISAKAEGDTLPLKVRFAGLALAHDLHSELPGDDTPPSIELKVEAKVTSKSVGSLAALAGATDELTGVLGELSTSSVGAICADALRLAIPVVSGAVAALSTRRAIALIKDESASLQDKALALAKAAADSTAVIFPLAGTLANLGLVLVAVGIAKQRASSASAAAAAAQKATTTTPQATSAPPTGPPEAS